MKRFIAFVLSLAVLSLSSSGLASGTSYYDTSEKIVETAKNRVLLENLAKESLAQQERETPRVVSEVIALWNKNAINISLPEKEYGSKNDQSKSWDRYIVIKGNNNDNFEIIYSIQYDGSRDNLIIEIPTAYRHLRKVFACTISYYTGDSISESYNVYDNLKKNTINSESQIHLGNTGIYLTVTAGKEIMDIERNARSTARPTATPSATSGSSGNGLLDYLANLFNGASSNATTTSKSVTNKPIVSKPTAAPINKSIVDLDTFLYTFNFYGALIGSGHTFRLNDTDEISKISDGILIKKIFNGCEILSLMADKSMTNITSIHCTLSTRTRGSEKYYDNFALLLSEVLLSVGMDDESAASALDKLSNAGAFKVGDSGKTTVNGLTISYNISSTMGLSFVIEKAQ